MDHLAECEGCRKTFENIGRYYEDVKREYAKASGLRKSTSKVIVPARKHLEQYFEPMKSGGIVLSEVTIPTLWRRARDFASIHPVASSLAGFILAIGLLIGSELIKRPDKNPSYFFYNQGSNSLDVYNRSDKLLFSMAAYDIKGQKRYEEDMDACQSIITDLSGKGDNEVITGVIPRRGLFPDVLRAYDGTGHLITSVPSPGPHIAFKGQGYDAPFQPGGLVYLSTPESARGLFAYYGNGRSPSVLLRLDDKLQVVGSYWHYGNFAPHLISSETGKPEIAIAGMNDLDDMRGNKYNFLAILDPSKITGQRESRLTPGFGFAKSDAEIYYVKFPKSSIEIAEGIGGQARITRGSGDDLIHYYVASLKDLGRTGAWEFEFVISVNGMEVREVKFSSPTPETFEALKKEGKVRGVFGPAYLGELKKSVRYWDGSKWVDFPTKIHPIDLAN